MLGHESIATTEIYLHLDNTRLREEILLHHPRNSTSSMKRLCTLLFLCFCLPATAGLSKFDAARDFLSIACRRSRGRPTATWLLLFPLKTAVPAPPSKPVGCMCGTAGDIAIVRGTREALLLASELEEVRSVRLQRR